MDYKDESYPKIPFYMTYPMQNMYLTEMEYEKDIERMKLYYPGEVQVVLQQVENRLDELESEGSRIYDEEPDQMMIQKEIDELCRKITGGQVQKTAARQYFDMVPMEISGRSLAAAGLNENRDDWLKGLVAALFATEMYRRRCRHRRCRRWW